MIADSIKMTNKIAREVESRYQELNSSIDRHQQSTINRDQQLTEINNQLRCGQLTEIDNWLRLIIDWDGP